MPTLETERLVLRPYSPADAPRLQRLIGDRAIADTTLNIPHPYLDGMAEEWIGASLPAFLEGKALHLAVASREDGLLRGGMGLVVDPAHERAELGYWIEKGSWNRGYATEAARALLAHGFGDLGLRRVYAHHFARNSASGRVLEKVGMRREGLLRSHLKKWDRFEDVVEYGILREEFVPRS